MDTDDLDDDEAALRAALEMSMQQDVPQSETNSTTSDVPIADILMTCWGNSHPTSNPEVLEVMRRWKQGFAFREPEPTAMVQAQGGPCGVLAPTQAHVLKHLLFDKDGGVAGDWRHPPPGVVDKVLAKSLADILYRCGTADRNPVSPILILATKECNTLEELHSCLASNRCLSKDDAEKQIFSNLNQLNGQFGVLQFMYSCVASRGIDQLNNDLGLDIEPLVVLPFGHANQSLINLMLTGIATPHVHDGIKDVGMQLKGVLQQPDIGYLTIMESLRYVQVGRFFKNPKCPIWVVGSETHLTVLYSLDHRLVESEGPITKAKRIFSEYDSAGGGFVMTDCLPAILEKLGIKKSQTELAMLKAQLGGDIVLLSSFLATMYPGKSESDVPPEFVVYHYNGIAPPGGEVTYCRGVAKSMAPRDFGTTPILRVLRTQWDPLQVEWAKEVTI